MKQLVIMCGGEGTRLKVLKNKYPKCLVKINKKTLLEHQIQLAGKYKFKNIILLSGYKHLVINKFLKKKFFINITTVNDKKKLGNGGALLNALEYLEDEFCLIYCDILTNINLNKLYLFFKKKKSDFCLVVNKNKNFHDSNLVKFNNNRIIKNIYLYPHKKIPKNCYSNESIFMCRKKKLENIKRNFYNKKSDFVKDLVPKLLKISNISAYKTNDYIIDCGTPERLTEARINFKSVFKNKK
jgi:NDP-sugar pyrophosphorylase family protein